MADAYESAAALATILSLNQSPQPYNARQFILEFSSSKCEVSSGFSNSRCCYEGMVQIFCCWARDAAVGVTKSITEPDTEPVVTVYTAALCLMFQILNWDFRYNTSGKKVV
ncbi:hypothetical protein GH714_001443 [Hevea brasiliensis]|uniref:Uncharacterized protein n=1 Tax=Hevea brasiliensis TaxID=3981 RepID=A0A6A6KGP7_HEVBR|nr:hypothetical protein GH714_001443 [Hevea brasiliensis]